MPDIRYFEEQPCEHGEMRRHRDSIPGKGGVGPICPGGSRRELTIVGTISAVSYPPEYHVAGGIEAISDLFSPWAGADRIEWHGARGEFVVAALARGDTREDQV